MLKRMYMLNFSIVANREIVANRDSFDGLSPPFSHKPFGFICVENKLVIPLDLKSSIVFVVHWGAIIYPQQA